MHLTCKIYKIKISGETPEVRSDERKQREEREKKEKIEKKKRKKKEKERKERKREKKREKNDVPKMLLAVDHDDGQFFRAMEWLMFFFRPPLTSMVFQWF